MSELSILELETEHVELLPEREALSVHVTQIALSASVVTKAHDVISLSEASNAIVINSFNNF
jgi:hypothetical protein